MSEQAIMHKYLHKFIINYIQKLSIPLKLLLIKFAYYCFVKQIWSELRVGHISGYLLHTYRRCFDGIGYNACFCHCPTLSFVIPALHTSFYSNFQRRASHIFFKLRCPFESDPSPIYDTDLLISSFKKKKNNRSSLFSLKKYSRLNFLNNLSPFSPLYKHFLQFA